MKTADFIENLGPLKKLFPKSWRNPAPQFGNPKAAMVILEFLPHADPAKFEFRMIAYPKLPSPMTTAIYNEMDTPKRKSVELMQIITQYMNGKRNF